MVLQASSIDQKNLRMKAASVKQLKDELKSKSKDELMDLCLHLSKFKKENKELLSYLLYDADNESGYISDIKEEVDELFTQINTKSYFYIKKSIRKILRTIKKYIRYSKKKETEVELLIYFCKQLKNMQPSYQENVSLQNIFIRQLDLAQKASLKLHEDLQYDYNEEILELKSDKALN